MTAVTLNSLVKKGGTIAIIGISHGIWENWKDNPALRFFDLEGRSKIPELPANTRAVILGRFTSHQHTVPIIREARRRNIILFAGKTDMEIKQLLTDIVGEENNEDKMIEQIVNTTVKPQEKKEKKVFGDKGIKKFVQDNFNRELDYTVRGSLAQEGRRLYDLLTQQGITTTRDSVIQAMTAVRKELDRKRPGKTAIMHAAKKNNLQLMELMDSAITDITKVVEVFGRMNSVIENLKIIKLGLQEMKEDAELKKKLKELLNDE